MTATIRIPQWLAKAKGYASTELEGDAVQVTEKAVRFKGHAVVRPSDHCLRCGQTIVNPVSRLAGYGPYCSDHLGIPRDFTADQIDEIRAIVERVEIEVWLPKSRIDVLAGSLVEPPSTNGHGAAAGKDTLRLRVEGDRIVAGSPFRVKDAIKQIAGRKWDGQRKAWTFPVSPTSGAALVKLAERHALVVDADDASAWVIESARTQDEAQAHKTAEALPPVPSKTTAWHHQAQAFWFAEQLPAAMLAMDMGTGKSKVAVDLVCHRRAGRVLILCPKSVLGVWPREFARHASCTVRVLAPTKGTIAARGREIVRALDRNRADGVPMVAVVNYESAWRQPMADLLLGTEWDLVILDESHRVKAPGGKASMFCGRLGHHARGRLCLTGTPMPHSPLDVYSQYRFLDPGIFGTSFAAFRNRYAEMGGYGNHEVLGYQRQDELAERMYSIGFRVMADDVLDLPDAIHVTRTTTLAPATRRTYRALSDQMFAEIGDGTVTAANVLTRLLRLQQVTSGHMRLDDDGSEHGGDVVTIGTEKRELLADTLEDVAPGEKVVVFARFTHDLDNVRLVAEAQGRVYGELSGRRRDGLAEDATMSPDVDVIGVQIQSGGVGIDLTAARYCIFYSVGYSLGDYDQALRRVHRPGQDRPVTYYHLLCEDTVDGGVYSALSERKDLVEWVLSGAPGADDPNGQGD